MHQLLEIIKLLSRNIRGRQENLSPLFVIGGVYEGANPLFQGRIELKQGNLAIAPLVEVNDMTFAGHRIGENTSIGIVSNKFTNEEEIRSTFGEKVSTIENTFRKLEEQISQYYGVTYHATPQD